MFLFGPPNVAKLKEKRDVNGMIKALSYKDAPVREAAAEALGAMGDARAVEPLIQALQDEKANVLMAVARSLGKLGDRRAVEPLSAALVNRHDLWESHPVIAEVLGEFGDPRAVDALIAQLNEWSKVRRAAAVALRTLYRSAPLSVKQKEAILSRRQDMITPHHDYNPSCATDPHSDSGIGIDFPL
jgi:HEAT repeat protein